MPRWEPWAGRGWAKYRKRYSIAQSFQEILSGVLPTVELERLWPDDFTSFMFSGSAQSWNIHVNGDPGAAGFYHSVALHNPTIAEPLAAAAAGITPVELLVYRVDAWVGFADPLVPGRVNEPLQWNRTGAGGPVRLFTVPNNYYDNSTAVVFTPAGGSPERLTLGIAHAWLQMGVGPNVVLRLPQAHFDIGIHNIHPIIAVGPNTYDARGPLTQPTGNAIDTPGFMFDAPGGLFLRLQPGQRLVAQAMSAFDTAIPPGFERAVFASFWWVERPYEEF